MSTVINNKVLALLDVNVFSLHQLSIEMQIKSYQRKLRWDAVLRNVKKDLTDAIFKLKQNELDLAEAQTCSVSWQNKALIAISNGLIEFAKNALIHKSYHDSHIQELLKQKELLWQDMNCINMEFNKLSLRVQNIKNKNKYKNGPRKILTGLSYLPILTSEHKTDNVKSYTITNTDEILSYSHIAYHSD